MKAIINADRFVEVLKSNESLYTDGFELSFSPNIFLDEHYRKAKAYDIVRFADTINVEFDKDGEVKRADIKVSVGNGGAIIDALNHSVFFVSRGLNDIEKIYYDKSDDVIGLFEELTTGGWENVDQM